MVTEPFDSNVRTLLPSALIGPFFMLQMLFLQNVPFVASATGLPLFAASGVVLLGDAFALLGFSLTLELRATPILRVLTLVGFTVLVYLLPMVSGPLAVAILLVTLVWSGGLLFAALSTGTPAATTPGVSRTSVVLGIGSLLFIFPAILFYISQQIAIPIPGAILPPFAGLLLGLAAFALMHEVEASPHEWWTRAVPLIALIIPVALFLTRPAIDTVTPSDAGFRLVNYNIHQAINTDGWVNPEAIAKVIEDEGADVVVLQEVTRGWLISGSLDIAEWLSARLGMPYYFAPAADGQFGNAILSRFPVSEWNFAPLPTEDLPMARSFFRAVIDTGVDESITIIGTHLSAFTDVVHRLPQIDALLSAWDGAPRTIITGDMNSHPDEADINRLLDAGLTSAGDPTIPTFISFDPTERIDYIFASEDLIFADFGVGSTTASDHLPLAVNVHYGE
jgi:endonuclease/exonuclease/phosphatase family metal-dependent hydrolase